MTNDDGDHKVAGDIHEDDGIHPIDGVGGRLLVLQYDGNDIDRVDDDDDHENDKYDGNHPIDGGGGRLLVLHLLAATSFKVPLVDHNSPQDDCVPGQCLVKMKMVMRINIVLKAQPSNGYKSIYCGSWSSALFSTFCSSTVCLS